MSASCGVVGPVVLWELLSAWYPFPRNSTLLPFGFSYERQQNVTRWQFNF